MSKLYADQHRALQERFDSRPLADRLEQLIVHDAFTPEEQRFLESRDMFFLSTLDAFGRPTVSYKGGAPGFVRVTAPSTLVFPSYDGNGMYYSMGNLAGSPKIGLLFIDFENPNRLRVQGSAQIVFDHPLLPDYPGAEFLVSVAVEEIWVNCPRYIHRYQKLAPSKYVPEAGRETPIPAWKRIDIVQDAIPARDKAKVDGEGGVITMDDYAEKVARGEG